MTYPDLCDKLLTFLQKRGLQKGHMNFFIFRRHCVPFKALFTEVDKMFIAEVIKYAVL